MGGTNSLMLDSARLSEDRGYLEILDQTRLPGRAVYLHLTTAELSHHIAGKHRKNAVFLGASLRAEIVKNAFLTRPFHQIDLDA